MHKALWVLQVILGIKFLSTAFTHALRQGQPTMREGIQRMGSATPGILNAAALVLVVASAGLLLPAAVKPLGWLVPPSAAVLALAMTAAIPLHLRCRAKPLLFASVILLVLSLLLAYGRWALVPLSG